MKKNTASASRHNSYPAGQTRKLRRADIILVSSFLILALILFAGIQFFFHGSGNYAEISVNGKITKRVPLNKNATYQITSDNGHSNTLVVSDGYASISQADCPDKLCVKQKKISREGETLTCLPHKVIITVIFSKSKKEFDHIAN